MLILNLTTFHYSLLVLLVILVITSFFKTCPLSICNLTSFGNILSRFANCLNIHTQRDTKQTHKKIFLWQQAKQLAHSEREYKWGNFPPPPSLSGRRSLLVWSAERRSDLDQDWLPGTRDPVRKGKQPSRYRHRQVRAQVALTQEVILISSVLLEQLQEPRIEQRVRGLHGEKTVRRWLSKLPVIMRKWNLLISINGFFKNFTYHGPIWPGHQGVYFWCFLGGLL